MIAATQQREMTSAAKVLHRHGRSFHWAAQVLSPDVRERSARLYAICRAIDDLADLPVATDARTAAGNRLEALQTAIRAGDTHDPIVAEAACLFAPDARAWCALEQLVVTARADIGPVRIADEDQLRAYADGVAGTVGSMMADVLDARRTAHARAAARELGIAMQYTNIARDVLEDARCDRRYLPATWLGSAVTPATIAAGDPQARGTAWHAVELLLQRADAAYERGWRGLAHLPPRARLGIAVAAHVYRRIGVRIRARGPHRYWQQRARVGTAGKVLASARGLALFVRATGTRPGNTLAAVHRAAPYTSRDGP